MARWLAKRIEEARPATVPGRLLAIRGDSGWFPALVRGLAHDHCDATVVLMVLGRGELTLLDRYEGREYRRAMTRARTATATLVAASVYCWRGPEPRGVPGGRETIFGGDFLASLEVTGRRSFTTRRGRR